MCASRQVEHGPQAARRDQERPPCYARRVWYAFRDICVDAVISVLMLNAVLTVSGTLSVVGCHICVNVYTVGIQMTRLTMCACLSRSAGEALGVCLRACVLPTSHVEHVQCVFVLPRWRDGT